MKLHHFPGSDWKLGVTVYKSHKLYGLTLYLGRYNLVLKRKVS